MKTLATERQAKSTCLKRELAKLATNAWWVFRDDHPRHPMVLRLAHRAKELTREIKDLEGNTSHTDRKGRKSAT